MSYDPVFKKFSYEEANLLLPEIIEITEKTIHKWEQAKDLHETAALGHSDATEESFRHAIASILEEWSARIISLGVLPKGYFTCDFVSPNPDAYFCWTYGEHRIEYTHKVDESFKDRVKIKDPHLQGFEFSLN